MQDNYYFNLILAQNHRLMFQDCLNEEFGVRLAMCDARSVIRLLELVAGGRAISTIIVQMKPYRNVKLTEAD